jgi:hypothetical protein
LIDARRSHVWIGVVVGALLLAMAVPRPARAFGERSAFDPRVLLAGGTTGPAHGSAPARWSWELQQRTSAPARLTPSSVRADEPAIVEAPFVYWSGDTAVSELTPGEVSGLRRFFALGGVMVVDDAAAGSDGAVSPFGRSARRQLERVLPDATPISLGIKHVIYHSFYLLNRAEGRVLGPPQVDAIVRGGEAQVVFTENDLGGALARGGSGIWEEPVVPGGELQREHAIRLAVNIAMYVLCTNYKDDQVHAPFLMRRRAHAMRPDEP